MRKSEAIAATSSKVRFDDSDDHKSSSDNASILTLTIPVHLMTMDHLLTIYFGCYFHLMTMDHPHLEVRPMTCAVA